MIRHWLRWSFDPPDEPAPPSDPDTMRKTTFWAILLVLALAAMANCAEPPARSSTLTAQSPQAERELRRRVLFFSAGWCGPCRSVKGDLKHPDRTPAAPCVVLQRAGWRVGPGGRDHIQIIDVDHSPDLARHYGVEVLPTFVLIDAGREVRRVQGAVDQWDLAALYKGVDERVVTRE